MARLLDVAAYFGKQHQHVLRSIANAHCSADFRQHNFVSDSNINSLGDTIVRSFDMTIDGFTAIVMGFTGAKAGEKVSARAGQAPYASRWTALATVAATVMAGERGGLPEGRGGLHKE